MINKTYVLGAFLSLFIVSGCVSDQQVVVAQYDDGNKNCEQLKYELNSLGAKFEDARDDSGLTGKNVALGIFFWPGIIVNENQSKKNASSVNDRIAHLNRLYSDKCIGKE